jgi:hypothetical protein
MYLVLRALLGKLGLLREKQQPGVRNSAAADGAKSRQETAIVQLEEFGFGADALEYVARPGNLHGVNVLPANSLRGLPAPIHRAGRDLNARPGLRV